jgi:Uncharacterized conserved protein
MIHVLPFEFGYDHNSQYPYFYNSRSNMNDYKMNINGKGSVMTEPDIAIVSLGVITENKELKAAQEENAAKSTEVINSLINSGIEEKDIKTEAYTINPEYDYVEGKQIFRGYKVTHTFKVTIKDIKKVGEIIDAAVSSGANVVNNITFTISNPSIYYKKALNLAIDDAIKKAKSIESNLEITVNRIPISITEEGQSYTPMAEKALYSAPTSATPIKEGQIEIIANIKAVFIYLPKTA